MQAPPNKEVKGNGSMRLQRYQDITKVSTKRSKKVELLPTGTKRCTKKDD